MAGAAQTGGAAAFIIHSLAPHALGSPVHTHSTEDEWSFVLDGEMGVEVGGDSWTVRPGGMVLKPRGIPHAFWNATDEPVRFLEVATPAGFEGYFEALGEVFSAGGPPDMGAVMAVAERYGLDIDPSSVPRLVSTYGLQLPG